MNLENARENPVNGVEAQALASDNAGVLLKTLPKPVLRRNVGGRPKGSFSRCENPLKRELHKEGMAVVRAAIAAAKGGDVGAQRIIIDRLLPRERLVKLALPRVRTAQDALQALATILDYAAEGAITTAEASNLSSLARSFIEIDAVARLKEQVAALKSKVNGQ